jgi:predicted nucleotidyltransferase
MNKELIQELEKEEYKQLQRLIDKLSGDSETFGLIRYGSSVKKPNYKDIDLCIVSQKNIPVEKRFQYKVFLPEKFDIHFFHELPLYIQHEVLNDAIYEYIKDYDNLFDICVESIRRYSLFKPHYKLYLEAVRNSGR